MKIVLSLLAVVSFFISCSSSKSLNTNTFVTNFTKQQQQLILAADTTKAMRVYKITNYSDSILLRTQSQDVRADPNDKVLQTFVKRLYRTVTDSMSLGVGIAAPQVGILKNIIWVQRFDKTNFPFEVYLNPKVVQYSELKQDCLEGCLSIPNRRDTTTTRAYTILLEYDKMDQTHQIEMVEGFTAVIFQHEIDHLNGILYLDHLQEELASGRKP